MPNIQTIYEKTRNLSVLFVEDDVPLRLRTVEVLEDYFHRVDSAVNGQDALEQYESYYETKKSHYDLVITDIQMPKMNGVELTSELYSIREDQPIIILSAHTESEYLLPLLNLGVAQFITKPIQYHNMMDVLYKVCSKIDTAKVKNVEDSSLIFLNKMDWWDPDKKVLISNGTDIPLTKYEICLMTILASKIGQICSSDEIINHFFLNNIDVNSENLRGMMMCLRKKLPEKTLTSIYGMGYRLAGSDQN